jgi:Tfp pilus assembly protein PilX
MNRLGCNHTGANEQGIALLTVLLMIILLTILGIAAITVTGLENRMAGFFRTTEAAAAAAQSCEGTAANIIQQTIAPPGQLPASFLSSAAPNPGPVPASNGATLQSEITGAVLPSPPAPSSGMPSENYSDAAPSTPNLELQFNQFTVRGDIDRLYIHNKPGMNPKDEGGQEILYRITCVATNAATGASSTVTSVYGCTFYSTGCYKKL